MPPVINAYSYRSQLTDLAQAIAGRWSEGYDYELIDTAYGNGTWLGAFQDVSEDAYEENDTLATAYDLSFQERTWLSNIDGLGQQYDDDWYTINVTPGYENVVADLRFTDAEGDIDLALYDDLGKLVVASVSVTDNEYIDTVVASPGTYYLRVYYDDAGNTYDLWWDDLLYTPAANSLPVALNDAFTLSANGGLLTGNVLANDSDPDGDSLTVIQVNNSVTGIGNTVTLASGAELTLNSDGSFVYDPNGQFTDLAAGTTAIESFSYSVSDGNGGTDTALAHLTIIQPSQPTSDFNIQVRFIDDNLTTTQQAAFTTAANRWAEIITGDLPDVFLPGFGIIDDVVIDASAPSIDGVGRTLGGARPTQVRLDSRLPAFGEMFFDSADIANLEADGSLVDVILHEMGHVLGIGSVWDDLGLLDISNISDPRFTGPLATAEYNALFGVNESSVPVEAGGGPGTALGHWRESIFDNELMTGFLNAGINPLSRITVASLADLGYTVNMAAADLYTIPAALESHFLPFVGFVPTSSTALLESLSLESFSAYITAAHPNNSLSGPLVDDVMEGTAGDDILRGDGTLRSPGGTVGGNDLLYGGAGQDYLGGKGGNDVLLGGDGNDYLWGDAGNDLLFGGRGNDRLTGDDFSGGEGRDLFVLAMGYGADTITDFEVGTDLIGLVGELTYASLTIGQTAQNTTIRVGNETLATLNNVNAADLGENSFISRFVPMV